MPTSTLAFPGHPIDRGIKDTPVYVNDRADVVNHEGAKNELAFAKQNALEIVKQRRSRGKMRHK